MLLVLKALLFIVQSSFSHAIEVPTLGFAQRTWPRDPQEAMCQARAVLGTFPACEKRSPATPRSPRKPPAEGRFRASISGKKMHRFLTAVWEELGLGVPLTVSNALELPSWDFCDRLAGSRDLATVRVHKRLSGCDGSEAVKSFRPSTARRYPPVGLTRPSPAGPACAGDPETKREKSVCVLPYKAHARRDQKCDYRKHQRASPMPRDSLQSPSWTPWTPFEASA